MIVVEGTVAAEGANEHRINAFPMTKAESANAWFVDMWAFDTAVDGRIELGTSLPGNAVTELHVGEAFELFAPTPGRARFMLAGRPPVEVATVKRDGANVATWTPTTADLGDARILTVAYNSESGATFTAIAGRVRVS